MDESLKTAEGKAIINRCTTLRAHVEIARRVIEGARQVCDQAGIALAGGHSIDTPEPIFGLAVTGVVAPQQANKNSAARPDCHLYQTKPLGIGILTTAEKKIAAAP